MTQDFESQAKQASVSVQRIRRFWQSRPNSRSAADAWTVVLSDGPPQRLAEPFTILASRALAFGETFLAQDIAREGRHALADFLAKETSSVPPALAFAIDTKLGHTIALAHARQGATMAALEELDRLEALAHESAGNPELVGLRARIHKDLALAQPATSVLRNRWLRQSHELYRDGYFAARAATDTDRQGAAAYLGINAAATAVWLGDAAQAAELARAVGKLCATGPDDDYWRLATLGEALLIERRVDEAFAAYQRARVQIELNRKWADLAATRRQARSLCEALEIDFASIDDAFNFPRFAVFSGHMVDLPGRREPRFPDTTETREALHHAIRQRLADERIQFAVCSAACGSDLIFIDEMFRAGGEVHVVIPWPRDQFIQSSVAPGGAYWQGEFARLLEQVSSISYLTQQTLPDEDGIAFEFCNRCINGFAMQRARALGAEIVPIAVWDGRTGDGVGGAQSFVEFWRGFGHDRFWIAPPAGHPARPADAVAARKSIRSSRDFNVGDGQLVVKTMLFADVVGYSKIPEAQIRSFPVAFLGPIATLIASGRAGRPIMSNTWGDAIYLVFDTVADGGTFALALRRIIKDTDWASHGLPPLNIRIGLHTGPVLLCVDPVLNRMTFTGPHVSHTARIEPIVIPGEVYATEGFVAHAEILAYQKKQLGFGYEYVGEMDFAKKYGRFPLFRLTESA